MKIFKDKVIVIVGATSGLGESTAYKFSEEGANIFICGLGQKNGEKIINKINKTRNTSTVKELDIRKSENCKKIMDEAIKEYKKIDVLINVAGITINKDIENTTIEDWDLIMDINLKSYFLTSKYAIPFLKETKGCIINVASLVGLIGQANSCAYSTSKGGVISLTKSLALDLAKYGIRVNAVCPDWMDTKMVEDWFHEQGDREQELRNWANSIHPFGRIGKPEETASAILFLASDQASNITGIALPVDGGVSLGY